MVGDPLKGWVTVQVDDLRALLDATYDHLPETAERSALEDRIERLEAAVARREGDR